MLNKIESIYKLNRISKEPHRMTQFRLRSGPVRCRLGLLLASTKPAVND